MFKVLSHLPISLGDYLYHSLQGIISKRDMGFKLNSGRNTYAELSELLNKVQVSLKGKRVIEIGSGWLPILPYLLIFEGQVDKVFTYDLQEHFKEGKIKVLNKFLRQEYKYDLLPSEKSEYALPQELDYYPRTNINDIRLPEVQLIFSRFVLEHVSPADLKRMHCKFKAEFPAGTHIIHFISPSDHRAYDDSSLSLQDFLKFSESEWEKNYTRFDYHNRLRLPQYLEIFENAGLEVVHLDFYVPNADSDAYKKFKKINIHPDFQVFSEEELLAGAINIILKT
ncbi:hypothetical protein [Salegentibacter chungangensis]|uniref:Class I SAM-dependent methyltransferase n=1 Tax=Salegentibacter chungangensis TaxID=1335724 RepID=A0ABW3NS98_9FLAO